MRLRAADATTIIRVLLGIVAAYMIIYKILPYFVVLLIGIVIFLDAIDGYFAVREETKGRIGLRAYLGSIAGNGKFASEVKEAKHRISKKHKYGARMDVAGDRVVEYTFWMTFTYLNIIPILILFIVLIRHSFADAFMASKGTSSKLKSRLARTVYASNIGRGGINVVKFATFSYLALVYTENYPIAIGYVLAAVLLVYILLRGAAEIYESTIK